jgi:hypothetical protein
LPPDMTDFERHAGVRNNPLIVRLQSGEPTH